MSPAGYANYRGFTRTAGTLPVVAIAALLGGAIGGFSVYAVVLALTDTPHETVAMKTDASAARPVVLNAVAPQPAAPANPALQTPASQTAASQTPTPQPPWPDALSHEHLTSPQSAATAETPPPASTPPAGPETVAAAPSKAMPPKPLPQKRRVVSRKPLPTPYQSSAEMAARSRPVYDYYNDNDRYGDAAFAPRGMNSPPLDLNRVSRSGRYAKTTGADGSNTRIVVRRQSRDGYYQSYVPRGAGPMLPPQPAPPGLFGGGYRDDSWR